MRMLEDSELNAVSGADCSGPPIQGEDVTVTGKRPRRRTPTAGATVIDDPFGIAMFMSSFAEGGGGWTGAFGVSTVGFGRGGVGGGSSDEGLQAEEWVKLWSEKFESWPEADRRLIGNSMVAAGALYMSNPFAMSAGQFLTLLGAAIAKGDVNSAAFYCDQLERTTLTQQSKDAVLGGLEAVLDVAKVFKDRFGK